MNVRALVMTGIVGASLVLSSCSPGGGASVTATSTPIVTPTTAASPSPAMTPDVPAKHVFTEGDQWTMTGTDGAQGSGCSPGAGLLPDGVWFGFAKEWSTSSIAIDLACHYIGAKAEAVATARGEEAFDFYITNDNTTVRVVTVAGDIPAHKAATDDGVFTLSQVIADPGGSEPTSSPYPVWIFVNGGVVTELTVQFLP